MEARAIARYTHISPQKARLVVNMVRGQRVEAALAILDFTQKKAAAIVAKTLRSAIANAEDQQSVDVDDLYVKTIFVDGGPTSGRFRPRAQGRATPIRKRTSHITIVVDTKGGSAQTVKD
ncbi:MAG: large subunit ribosomal protein L22 [Hyphomicrobiaceae bacterium]|jgi:large subunit ribosomal protein L22